MSAPRVFQFSISTPPCTLSTMSRFFYRKESLNYIQEYPDGTAVRLNQRDVLSVLKAENNIEHQRDVDVFFYNLRHDHSLDYDGSMPGYKLGLHELNGLKYYCTAAPQPVVPARRDEAPVEFGAG